MRQAAREWLAGLRQRVEITRRGPGPAAPAGRSPASAAARAAERMILATHLVAWIDNELQALLEARHRAPLPDPDPHPAIVITTSSVGIDVVADVLARAEPLPESLRDSIVAVTEREYRDWTRAQPDPDHRLHVSHWSWVKADVPVARRDEFAAHRLAEGESFWLHRTGTVGFGGERRFCHLWKWNGATAILLEPFVEERVRRL